MGYVHLFPETSLCQAELGQPGGLPTGALSCVKNHDTDEFSIQEAGKVDGEPAGRAFCVSMLATKAQLQPGIYCPLHGGSCTVFFLSLIRAF